MDRSAFFRFCQANRDLRIERDAEGNIIIMAQTGTETGGRNASLTAQLYLWSKTNGARLGFLIDPAEKTVTVYRAGVASERLSHPPTLSAEPDMPGLVFDLDDVW